MKTAKDFTEDELLEMKIRAAENLAKMKQMFKLPTKKDQSKPK